MPSGARRRAAFTGVGPLFLALAFLVGCTSGGGFSGTGSPPPSPRGFAYNPTLGETARMHSEFRAQPGLELIGAHYAYGRRVTGSGGSRITPPGRVNIGIGGAGLQHNHAKIDPALLLTAADEERMLANAEDGELAQSEHKETLLRSLTAAYNEGASAYPAQGAVNPAYVIHVDEIDLVYTPPPPPDEDGDMEGEDGETMNGDAGEMEDMDAANQHTVFSYVAARCADAMDYADETVDATNCPATDADGNPIRYFIDFGENGTRDLRIIPDAADLLLGSQSAGIIANRRGASSLPQDAQNGQNGQNNLQNGPFHGVAFGAGIIPHIAAADLNASCANNANEETTACLTEGDIVSHDNLTLNYDRDRWLADYINAIPGGTSNPDPATAVDIFLLDVAWQGNGVVPDDETTTENESDAHKRSFLEGSLNDTLVALEDFVRRRGNLSSLARSRGAGPLMVVRSAYQGFEASVPAPATPANPADPSADLVAGLGEAPDTRGGPRTLAALPYYYEQGCDENDVDCRDLRGSIFTAVALGGEMTASVVGMDGMDEEFTLRHLDPASPRCGPLPANWNAQTDGRHYCLTAPGTGTRINGGFLVDDMGNFVDAEGNMVTGDDRVLDLAEGYRVPTDADDYQPDLYAAAFLAGSYALMHERFRGALTSKELGRRLMDTADRGTDSDSALYGFRTIIRPRLRAQNTFTCMAEAPAQAGEIEDERCAPLRIEAAVEARINVRDNGLSIDDPNYDSQVEEETARILAEQITATIESETDEDVAQEFLETFGAGLIDLQTALTAAGEQVISTASGAAPSASFSLSSTSLEFSPAFGDGPALALAGQEIMALDSLGAPFWHPLNSLTSGSKRRQTLANRHSALSASNDEAAGLVPLSGGGFLSLSSWRDAALFSDIRGSGRFRYETPPQAEAHRLHMSLRQPLGGSTGEGNDTAILLAAGDMASLPLGLHTEIPGANDAATHPWLALVGEGIGMGAALPLGGGRLTALGFSSAAAMFDNLPATSAETDASPRRVRGGLLEYALPPIGAAQIALQAGALLEENHFLATRSSGGFAGMDSAATGFAALSLDAALSADWHLRGRVFGGMTHADTPAASLIADWSATATSAFSLALTGDNILRRRDRLGISLAQPLRVESGSATFLLPTQRTTEGAVLHQRVTASLAPSGRELTLSARYQLPVSENTTLSLNAGLVHDGGHSTASEREIYALGNLRFRF